MGAHAVGRFGRESFRFLLVTSTHIWRGLKCRRARREVSRATPAASAMKPRPSQSVDPSAQLERLVAAERYAEVVEEGRRILSRAPRSVPALLALSRALLALGRLDEVGETVARGLALSPSEPRFRLLKAVAEHRLGRTGEAVELLRALRGGRPGGDTEATLALAEMLHRAARHDELRALLAEGGAWRDDERAALHAARVLARTDRGGALAELERLARSARGAPLRRIAGFEAVRMLDADGRHREAFELARATHASTTPRFDIGGLESDLAEQIRWMERHGAGLRQTLPSVERCALVVGMPRSGTTLVEQMLDRHPAICGIGEFEGVGTMRDALVALGAWPAQLHALARGEGERLRAGYLRGAAARRREGATWTFDKTLQVWRSLPAVAAVLGGAALVRIVRDPRDMAISMFLSNFHPQSWGFTASLDAIRRAIALERRVVPLALKALELRAVEVVYEDLVDAPEQEMRRVLDFLGVPFDRCVLSPEANTRTVLTLSHEQVRRPINRSSIGRWRNYEFAFGPEWDALV